MFANTWALKLSSLQSIILNLQVRVWRIHEKTQSPYHRFSLKMKQGKDKFVKFSLLEPSHHKLVIFSEESPKEKYFV